MEVFLIPVGRERYELYSEPATDPSADADVPSTGFFGRLRHRFGVMLAAAEARSRLRAEERARPEGWLARAQEWMLGWVAEKVVEQRLLWTLRRQETAVAAHPTDLSGEEAIGVIRRELQRDYERHRIWLVVYTIGLIASAPLAIVPGPNVVAYYLAFGVVGHWLSLLGAGRGLSRVAWSGRPCVELSELRNLGGLEPGARHERVREVGSRLHLQHLPHFFERVAGRRARAA